MWRKRLGELCVTRQVGVQCSVDIWSSEKTLKISLYNSNNHSFRFTTRLGELKAIGWYIYLVIQYLL